MRACCSSGPRAGTTTPPRGRSTSPGLPRAAASHGGWIETRERGETRRLLTVLRGVRCRLRRRLFTRPARRLRTWLRAGGQRVLVRRDLVGELRLLRELRCHPGEHRRQRRTPDRAGVPAWRGEQRNVRLAQAKQLAERRGRRHVTMVVLPRR